MDRRYIKQVLKVFFGMCMLLISVVLLLFNLFLLDFDIALLLPNALLFLAGLLLTVFGISSLPAEKEKCPIASVASYQSPIKMCKAHFNCDIVIGTRRIFAMLTLSSRKCNAGTALKTD